MIDAPLALAFTAGLVATVNPCGFAMLPAYASYFMGLEDNADRSTATAIASGLRVGVVVSVGFMAVFGIFGIFITLGLRSIMDAIPWVAIVIGGGVGILGIAMLFGYQPVISLPKFRSNVSKERNHSAVLFFGVSYAIASLSCTLPIFLTVVAGAVSRGSFISGFVTFLVYGLGMSVVLIALTITLALGKKGLLGWLRKSGRFIGRVSGVILVLAGAYIILFWATNLGDPTGPVSGPIFFIERLSSQFTQSIGDNPALWGVGFAAIVAAGIAAVFLAGGSSGKGELGTEDASVREEAL